ncbi:MAG: hypothetical protein K2Y18_00005, partial [Alphaproteobacteria bacterium]|nr:hypothetical protein [Alphaproteobacteria bacterium]
MDKRYSNKHVMELLNEIETKFPVEKWTILNIHIWPTIRNSFCWLILKSHETPSLEIKRKDKIKFSQKIKLLICTFGSLVELMIHFFTTQKAQTLFLSDGISKFKINNTYYDKFCDPICDLKKIS